MSILGNIGRIMSELGSIKLPGRREDFRLEGLRLPLMLLGLLMLSGQLSLVQQLDITTEIVWEEVRFLPFRIHFG